MWTIQSPVVAISARGAITSVVLPVCKSAPDRNPSSVKGINRILRRSASEAGAEWQLALGHDVKGKLSIFFYMIAIPVAFYDERISQALFVLIALMWLVPDRRIVRALRSDRGQVRTLMS